MATVTAIADRKPELFLSDSGRTAGTLDRAGMQRLAEEHEWLRDRVAHLELEAALLRSVLDVHGIRPGACVARAEASAA